MDLQSLKKTASNLHHAYCIECTKGEAPELFAFFKKELGIDRLGNPDVYHRQYGAFGIDDSRVLKEYHASRPLGAHAKKLIVVELDSITNEAQNSLLKILEEPQESTHFFFLIPSISFLLPTLRSRMVVVADSIVKKVSASEAVLRTEAKEFFEMSIGERVQYACELAEKVKDEKMTKQEVIDFLDRLEIELQKDKIHRSVALSRLIKARDYMNDRSPSIKQLLEYVALSV